MSTSRGRFLLAKTFLAGTALIGSGLVAMMAPAHAMGGQREFFADAFGDQMDFSNTEDIALIDEGPIQGVAGAPTMSDGQMHMVFNGMGYFSPLWGGYDTGGHTMGSEAIGHDREGNLRALDGTKYTTLRVRMNVSAAVGAGLFFYTCSAGVNDGCQSGRQFVTEPGWHVYEAAVPRERVSGIRVAISGNVTADIDWVQVVGAENGNVNSDNVAVGPIPEVLNPDAAGAVPYLFPLGGKPVPYQSRTCANNDWATTVRGDAWDFNAVTDVDKIDNYTTWGVANNQFNGVGALGKDGAEPGDPGVRMNLSGRTINPAVWHRTTVIVPRWDGRYSQIFGADGGWVFRALWKFALKPGTPDTFQMSLPVVEYPNDTTLTFDLNDPTPLDGSPVPAKNAVEIGATQFGWSADGRQVRTFRVDMAEPYRPRETPISNVLLATDDCGANDADIVFRDNNYAAGGTATIYSSASPIGPWAQIGSTPVGQGINAWTWANAPQGTWFIKIGMNRDGSYGEHHSSGPVTIGTEYSGDIAASRGKGGASVGTPNQLAFRAPKTAASVNAQRSGAKPGANPKPGVNPKLKKKFSGKVTKKK
jgi:hypothetical protein